MKLSLLVPCAALVTFSGSHLNLPAQQHPSGCVSEACAAGGTRTQLSSHADEVAEILGIKPLMEQALAIRASRPALP